MSAAPVVSSHNEWDPLEEVVVGTLEGAAIPSWHFSLQAVLPDVSWSYFEANAGRPYRQAEVLPAMRELDELARILACEGVTVRRPQALEHGRPFATPDWSSQGGNYAAMPRDLLIVVGDQIIEAPLAWRCRHFEVHAYRELLKEYFRQGARWVSAPAPVLSDAQFRRWHASEPDTWVTTEHEPTFDAADFVRCGRDIFVQRSHVTNEFGIRWFERQIGPEYRVHRVDVHDPHAMHIDATLVPLCPGKVLVNAERLPRLPDVFRGWDVLRAPSPTLPPGWPMYFSSAWVSINVLMLDERRVLVEAQEAPLIAALEAWGFECVKVPFRHVMTFGGSFHCVTLDVRRRGTLQSYFPAVSS